MYYCTLPPKHQLGRHYIKSINLNLPGHLTACLPPLEEPNLLLGGTTLASWKLTLLA